MSVVSGIFDMFVLARRTRSVRVVKELVHSDSMACGSARFNEERNFFDSASARQRLLQSLAQGAAEDPDTASVYSMSR